jgi:sugar phosphate isomerase/epimerase
MMDGNTKISVSLSPTESRFGPLLFAGHLDQGLKIASELGFDGVELSLRDSTHLDRKSVVRTLGKFKLAVFAIATGQTYYTDGFSLFGSDESLREKAIARIAGHVDFASEIEAMVIIGGIRGTVRETAIEEQTEIKRQGMRSIKRCLENAENKGVTLLLEPINRYETNIVNTLEQGCGLIKEIGSSKLKLLPDTFHMNIEEASLPESIRATRGLLGYMHFADSNRLAPGWGHLNFSEVLLALNVVGYTGPIGVEILPGRSDYDSAKQAIQYVRSLIAQLDKKGSDAR